MSYGPRPTPAHVRVLRRVTKSPNGCWLYDGPLDRDGYGLVKAGSLTDGTRTTKKVHRVLYEASVGPIPTGLFLDHLCRVRNCVNPDHLEPVTPRENVLRGETGAARNLAKTHCPRGHEYAGDNLLLEPTRGGVARKCKTCVYARNRNAAAARRARVAS